MDSLDQVKVKAWARDTMNSTLPPQMRERLEQVSEGTYPYLFKKGDLVKHVITGYTGQVKEDWHEFLGVGILVKFEHNRRASRVLPHNLREYLQRD